MIMATEKRKSTGGPAGTPNKFQKNQQGGKSPMGGKQGKPQQKGSPNKPNQRPPPPPKGAKQLKVELKQDTKKGNQQNQKQKPFQKKGKDNGALNKVSEQSKNINKSKRKFGRKMSGQKKAFSKMDVKPRDRAECERALQAEIDLGHNGRVFTVKLPDPIVNSEVVKGWSSAIETSVFPKPVEPRQLFIVFKSNANVKKEVESLKKVSFGGGKLQVEERIEGEQGKLAEQIDPVSLYLSNIHESTSKDDIQKLFKKATSVTTPKKHGPRVKSQTKFAFIIFANADDALASFKENYTSVLHGNTLVMRFRRISSRELQKQQNRDKQASAAVTVTDVKKNTAAPATPQAKKPTPAQKPVKKEIVKPESDSEEEDDDDEDDSEDEGMGELKMDEDVSGEEEEDDDDDDLEEEEDDDDDDDDDDEEEDDD